ncbi:MAG: hypothetical protein ACI9IV_000530 [Paracoccaceae bacterium]|jgi:hypothetical protein|tara:strand:+ start:830 stop:937 length:108 start_codon:yes stop_codon:yes gene_type:complete
MAIPDANAAKAGKNTNIRLQMHENTVVTNEMPFAD